MSVRTFHEVDPYIGRHPAEPSQPQHHGDLSAQGLDLTPSALCVYVREGGGGECVCVCVWGEGGGERGVCACVCLD